MPPVFADGQRLRADRVEAEARRQHQALLRAGDRDVHAPGLVFVVHRGEGGDGVHHQQRRVAAAVDRLAHGGDAAGDAGGGFVVHYHHGLDRVAGVRAELGLDRGGVHAVPPVTGDQVHVKLQALGHRVPQGGELAGFHHHHAVPGGEGVDDRRLPRAGAAAGEDDDGAGGCEDALHALEYGAAELAEIRTAVVDGGHVDRAEYAVRHVAGAWDLEEVPAALERHDAPRV